MMMMLTLGLSAAMVAPPTAMDHYQRGVDHFAAGKARRAAACIRRSLKLEITPQGIGALHAVGEVLMEEGAHEAAEACWRHSLSVEPLQVGVRERLASTLKSAGRLLEAAEAMHLTLQMEEAAMDDEERGWLWTDLGALLEDIAPLPGSGPEDTVPELPVTLPALRVGGEMLTAGECYRRAIASAPQLGAAHKKYADMLVLSEGAQAAHPAFERAAALLGSTDVCCATHAFYGSATSHKRRSLPPLPQSQPAKSSVQAVALPDLIHSLPPIAPTEAGSAARAEAMAVWASDAARHFERHGVIVLPGLLDADQLSEIASACADMDTPEDIDTPEDVGDETGEILGEFDVDRELIAGDFTPETRAPDCRTHMALSVGSSRGLKRFTADLWPLLSRILQAEEAEAAVPVIGYGFMRVRPGAQSQALHKDVHGHDRHVRPDGASPAGGPRAISIQLQLTDTSRDVDRGRGNRGFGGGARRVRRKGRGVGVSGSEGKADADGVTYGSLVVLPGSHRPDATCGSEAAIRAAIARDRHIDSSSVQIDVPAGSVTIYSSRLWHRGGANTHAKRERSFAFLTLAEPDAPAPAGLIHTMAAADVGEWVVGKKGLVPRSRSD